MRSCNASLVAYRLVALFVSRRSPLTAALAYPKILERRLFWPGMVEGNRPRGRPTRRWSDDITDWRGCTLPEAVQLANDRDKSLAAAAHTGHEFEERNRQSPFWQPAKCLLFTCLSNDDDDDDHAYPYCHSLYTLRYHIEFTDTTRAHFDLFVWPFLLLHLRDTAVQRYYPKTWHLRDAFAEESSVFRVTAACGRFPSNAV